jgi:hypothetical protein
VDDVSDVADLVGDLDNLATVGHLWGVDDLQTLPLGFRQALIISHFFDEIPDIVPESLSDIVERRLGILYGIVKYCRLKNGRIFHSSYACNQLGNFHNMINIGHQSMSFSLLLTMLLRSIQYRCKQVGTTRLDHIFSLSSLLRSVEDLMVTLIELP